MAPTVWKFILRYSAREQLLLLVFTVFAFPFLYVSLDLPKVIINEAIAGTDFPRVLLGFELDQIPYLMALCGLFLVLVLINGGFKLAINVYRGVVGERMLRRLRYQLFSHVLRFPMPHFRRTSQGEIVAMIAGETEPLGGYIGDSVALPAFQGGTLLTILIFMFVQDPVLGLAAIALYPIQAYLIPKLQKRVNVLKKERTVEVRRLSERIGEVVGGIKEVHTHDTSHFELAEFARRMGRIYRIRYRIYLLKFFIKFVNNFIAQITPFFFFAIGGYQVIEGDLSFGALVAVLAAYKDLSGPWKELLNFYQIKEDARIKYELLYESFQPTGMLAAELQAQPPDPLPSLGRNLVVSNIDLTEEDEGDSTFAGTVSFSVDLGQSVSVLGDGGSGRDRLAPILSGVRRMESGAIHFGGIDMASAPEAVTGRRIAYVSQEPNLRSGTVADNLYYSLKHQPVRPMKYGGESAHEREWQVKEARLSGNTDADPDADWIDYPGAGVEGPEQLTDRALTVLKTADMGQDIFEFGLRGNLDLDTQSEFAERVLDARAELRYRLEDPEVAALVEQFDSSAYNTNMSVAENLMFGTPRDPSFHVERLAENPYVRKVLHETELMQEFLQIGHQVAEVMVDLFADVERGSELFEQFSFISFEDLPRFRSLLSRASDGGIEGLEPEDRVMLVSLPFKLVLARHRLGLIDDRLRDRLLGARRVFAEGFEAGSPPVDFFDAGQYNPAVSIQDNILFGRLAYGRARSAVRIGEIIEEVVDKLGLRRPIMELGLAYPVGVGGSRLSPVQRQKLSIARSILKRPEILLLDDATAAMDAASQARIMDGLRAEFSDRTLIWSFKHASLGEAFSCTLVLEGGRVVEQGRFEELLNRPNGILRQLVSET